jgi:hypothetical protein
LACSSYAQRYPVAREQALAVAGTTDLTRLLVAIANLDHKTAVDLLSATPSLATAGLARGDEFFLPRVSRSSTKATPRCMPRGSVTTPRWRET